MRAISISKLAAATLAAAVLLASCGVAETKKTVTAEPLANSGSSAPTAASGSAAETPEAKVPEQTPSQNAAAEAFSNHDVKKCDSLGSGS